MLWVAAVLAAVGGMPQLAIAIVVVVLINGLFSFAQEERASHAALALSDLIPQRATVLRDGQRTVVEAASLVPGDIMLLREGDRVSADARLLNAEHLLVDNSTLTGESERVLRGPDPHASPPEPISQASDLVFSGTYVAAGSGQAVVIATGSSSLLGADREVDERRGSPTHSSAERSRSDRQDHRDVCRDGRGPVLRDLVGPRNAGP